MGGKLWPVTVLASLLPFATFCGLHQSDVFMESNLSFLASRAISAPTTDASPAASHTHTHAEKRDFADVFNGQTLKAQRQQLAALDAPGEGLQVVPLGSKLNIITSDAPLPDMDSLAQFARMQGLDEGAVQALFGTHSVGPNLAPMSALAELPSLGPDNGKEAVTAPEEASAIALAAPSSLDLLAASPSNVASLIAPVIAPTPLSKLALHASLGVKEISVALGAAPSAPALGAVVAAQTSLMPMTAQAWIGSTPVAEVDASAAMPPLAAQDAVRLTLAMPAPEITKRLAQMSGTGKEATWAALLASGPVAKDLPAAMETLTLELPPGFDPELLASATDASTPKPSDLFAQAGAAGALPASAASAGSGNSADTAQAQAEQRAQQFQQLADKMGQAAAQRLIAQIERGQWKMQMRMQPAALGSINVELEMHAGGLDALFSTDNAVTRELMAQGSNKLRDTLTQAGMTVASVTVNGEQSRQSGGNSTPGKGRNPSSGARPDNSPISAAAAPQGGPAATADGLNVLA